MRRSFLRLRPRNRALIRRCVARGSGSSVLSSTIQLHITEEGFRGIVVWACLGQTDPVQFEPAHQSPRLLRLTRVGGILIERDPDLRIAIPASHPVHELADVMGSLARQECPVDTTAPHIVDDKQVEATTRLLPAVEHQTPARGITPPAIGFDGYRLFIEEQQGPLGGKVTPDPADLSQNCRPTTVSASEFALHPEEANPPFFSTRRRCSRLIALRTRCRIR